ncbi:MAG: VTT domain-containing protein [Eubacteriales bacterium]|nr:VTT domain-containing protein [Eubacteriales bacterium]
MINNKSGLRKARVKIESAASVYARRKRWRFQRSLVFIFFGLFLLSTYLIFHFWGNELLGFITDPERVRAFVANNPLTSRLFFIVIIFIQVILAFFPGEAFEIGAGYAFGGLEGALISIVGILLASVLIFKAVRRFGRPVVELFFTPEQIDSVKFLQNPKNVTLLTFIIFLVPGTPKDILTYLAGLTPITMKSWIVITTLGRLPSVITSTVGGSLLNSEKYLPAVIVFLLTAFLAFFGVMIYKRVNRQSDKSKGTEPF